MEAGIIEIEQLVAAEQIQEARDKFRCFLRECAKCTKEDATYGDILSLMAERTSPYPHVGALLLRYIAVPQLFPESNRTNQISRSILSICEKALPDICRFLHVHERRQTFDKFSVLVSTHYSVCTLLAPLKQAPIDVISLLGFRQISCSRYKS